MFVNNIKDIASKTEDKLLIFVDMDGVVADYDIVNKEKIKRDIKNMYLNKRPINTIINIIKDLNKIDNAAVYILSTCKLTSQKDEKQKWLDKYMPFISKERRLFIVKEEINYSKENRTFLKAEFIKDIVERQNASFCIMIDDEHELLNNAKELLKDKIMIFHVSSILD